MTQTLKERKNAKDLIRAIKSTRMVQLKELNDGSFGVPEAHNNIRHPDYFEAKKEFDGFWSKLAKAE